MSKPLEVEFPEPGRSDGTVVTIDPPRREASPAGSPVPFAVTLAVRDTCLCLHVQRAARALARRFDDALRPLGLTNGQFSLLMSLNRPEPAGMGGVAALLAMDRTTLTAALKPLVRRGLVSRRPRSGGPARAPADPDAGRTEAAVPGRAGLDPPPRGRRGRPPGRRGRPPDRQPAGALGLIAPAARRGLPVSRLP